MATRLARPVHTWNLGLGRAAGGGDLTRPDEEAEGGGGVASLAEGGSTVGGLSIRKNGFTGTEVDAHQIEY
jgi:hypothetical protein